MGKLGGEASIELDAPIADVWPVVEDVARSAEWQEGLEEVNVLDRDGAGRVVRAETVSDAKVRQVRSTVTFTYDEPRQVAWRQEKGDLKSVDGSWTLEDLGGGRTRAVYRMEGDPGRMLGMLIRGPVEERLKEILVGGRPRELAARLGVSA